jgi:hypothetical protein
MKDKKYKYFMLIYLIYWHDKNILRNVLKHDCIVT